MQAKSTFKMKISKLRTAL